MRETFEIALRPIAAHEGGFSNHPNDPGGPTMAGITQAVYNGYRRGKGLPTRPVNQLTQQEKVEIFRENYWNPVMGDRLPLGIDYCLLDGAIHSGPSQATKWLQRAIKTPVDGSIGPVDLLKLDELRAHEDKVGDAIIDSICDQRMAFLRTLKNWPSFARGWTTRVAEMRKLAKQMNNRQPLSRPTEIPSADMGRAPPSQTKVSETPTGDVAIKTGTSGLLAMIGEMLSQASDVISQLTYLPVEVVRIGGGVLLVAGIVALVGYAGYSIWKVYDRRARREDQEAF